MTIAPGFAPTDLDRLLATETELETLLAGARDEAAAMVAQARAAAEAMLAGEQAALAGVLANRRLELVAERSAREAQVLEEGRRRATRYEGVNDETVESLADWIVAQLAGADG